MLERRIIKYLKEWKEKDNRKPFILRGARQVGKTFIIWEFGKRYFKDVIYLNMENPEHFNLFLKDVSLEEFEKIVEIKFHKKITSQSLVFIDEIQNSPPLIRLLRFFYEDKPEIPVICAGSLFKVKIEKEGLNLPVGRVEYLYLYPLDFFEYLMAKNEDKLLEFLKNIKVGERIPEGIHKLALKLFYEYTMIGGMPEVVNTYLNTQSIEKAKKLCSDIFTAYSEDIYKYTSFANAKYINYVIEKSPLFCGEKIKYENFAGSNFRSREIHKAFELLEKVKLLYEVKATKSTQLPLIPKLKRPKKLIFLDVGLVNYKMGIYSEYLNISDLNEFYRGKISEQIVVQNLIAQYSYTEPEIFYWAKEKPVSRAEVDFCLAREEEILGIEVKSGISKKLKSLFIFALEIKNSQPLRIWPGEFKREMIEVENKKINLISLPFYLVCRVLEKDFLKKI